MLLLLMAATLQVPEDFAQIQDALDEAQPGDTIIVQAGTYAALETQRDGTEQAPITIEAVGEVVVQAEEGESALKASHAWYRWEGLVFDGGLGGKDVLRTGGADHAEYRGIEVRNAYGGDCIDLRNASDVLIVDASIHHCLAGSPSEQVDSHGVTGDSVFDVVIQDTEIAWTTGDAVQFSPPREPWDRVLIQGCTLSSGPLDQDIGPFSAGDVIGENALDTKVGEGTPRIEVIDTVVRGYNGAIVNAAAFNIKEEVLATLDGVVVEDCDIGFRLRHPASVLVYDALVTDTSRAFRLEDGLEGVVIAHATVIGGEALEYAGGDPVDPIYANLLVLGALPVEWEEAGRVATEEDFVEGYQLASSSSAIDAGVVVDSGVDLAGQPRDEAPDLGAFEWLPPQDSDDPDDSDPDDSDPDDSDPGPSPTEDCGCASTGLRSSLSGLVVLVLLGWSRRR